ncbi:reverse transcriptase domain-containing protein [Nephila pilipes]|uniref:Reverse transcriptase domain-containing protein n=1 Tax=Nephila pilipes TaxID=299642 RepID=A0A8X6QRU3_NEPPI|nr:reverse transcriptase domain-containing protein [Nephila pilipes]
MYITKESNFSKQLSESWNLENFGTEVEVFNDENIEEDIMSELEAEISYRDKMYEVKFPWKSNMKVLLENNEQVAKKRFMKLRSHFKSNHSLLNEYRLVLKNYLSKNIIERVPVDEENLKQNTFYLHHREVIRIDKATDASKKAYGTVAYLRIKLDGGNIISSFVASKSRTAPLKNSLNFQTGTHGRTFICKNKSQN